MKSMKLAIVGGVVGFALCSGAVFAGGYKHLDCSHGYWKTHPEVWNGVCCDTGMSPSCAGIQEDLEARGPGSVYLREGARAYLNACVDPEDANCDD